MKDSVFTAVLALAGDPPRGLARDKLVELAGHSPRPYIVAADGGAAYLAECGIQPEVIIGDGDSTPPGLFAAVPRQALPTAKNFTDGEAAFAYLFAHCQQGRIAVFGALGGRLDHLLANIFLPLQWQEQAPRLTVFADDGEAVYSLGHAKISGVPGDTLSIIPISAEVEGITLTHLAYGLNDYDLYSGSSRCVSNVMLGSQAIIDHRQGLALIIHYADSPERKKAAPQQDA